MRSSKLEIPGEYYRHNIKYQVGCEHEVRVEVEKVVEVDTISWQFWPPGFVEGSALKQGGENAAAAESECNEVHEIDAAEVLLFTDDLGVEK